MVIEKMTAEMDYVPIDFQVRNLGGSCYEIMQNLNITKDDTGERVIYRANTTLQTAKIYTLAEAVTALKRMRYSQDEEIELTNVGILNALDSDYKTYRDYAIWCKNQSTICFSNLV